MRAGAAEAAPPEGRRAAEAAAARVAMERERRLRAPCAGKAPRKKRRSSPLPGAAALPGSRAGSSQICRRRLFGSAGPRGPEPACQKKKFSGKNLPKIKENVEYAEESSSCNQSCSNQVTVSKTTDFKIKEEEPEESSVSVKDSKIINFESKGSLKNAEVTSSAEITLPTGVSTFLIECLDEDSAADYSTASDSLKTYSSPETFRDDDFDIGKHKNSTLLDSSKAVTIDKIPQISNLSAISEPVPKDFPDRHTKRKRPSSCYYSSSGLSISATLAGKKLCKITAASERTPDLKSGMRCSSPLGPESKYDNRTAKAKRLKKKESSFNPFEEGSSSFRQLDAPENKSARSKGLTAGVPPTKPTDAVVLSLSPVCKASPGEDLFLNTTGPFVNSEEIVPASLSSEKEIIPQSPEEKNILKPLCERREICSIVRLSPEPRPSRLHQVPVNSKKFCLPKGLPEDIITSTKNWIYSKQR
ncbi:meiosis-specific kinetochore protein isoform X2 [Pyrgilauda ruficollis]|uniref:meiosis-specific kinetochore protein isoform X2 n=1 Tax=Pyrgilauda ruficollis TaxID=221976 RepID=UPI001B880875|nr:meiosis-specific kinetochore protein isoform X2 [Pyrgilauda ruficollis]